MHKRNTLRQKDFVYIPNPPAAGGFVFCVKPLSCICLCIELQLSVGSVAGEPLHYKFGFITDDVFSIQINFSELLLSVRKSFVVVSITEFEFYSHRLRFQVWN